MKICMETNRSKLAILDVEALSIKLISKKAKNNHKIFFVKIQFMIEKYKFFGWCSYIFCRLIYNNENNLLIAACEDKKIKCIDTRSSKFTKQSNISEKN